MIQGIPADPGIRAADLVKEVGELHRPDANGDTPSFEDLLTKLIDEVDVAQQEADDSIKNLATGESGNLQDVVMKLEEADLTFRLMKEIRDKLVEAYKEVISIT